jgi:hypothetical protein
MAFHTIIRQSTKYANFSWLVVVFILLIMPIPTYAGTNFVCGNERPFTIWEEGNGRYGAHLRETGGAGCGYEGISLKDNFGRIFATDGNEDIYFFSGFLEHCSSGTILIFNAKTKSLIKVNSNNFDETEIIQCELEHP